MVCTLHTGERTYITYFLEVHVPTHTTHAAHTTHTTHTAHTTHATHAISIKIILIRRTILFILIYPSVEVGFDKIVSEFCEARPIFRLDIFLLELEIKTTRTENF